MTTFLVTLVVIGGLTSVGVYLLLERNLTRMLLGLLLIGNAVNLLILTVGGPSGNPPVRGRISVSATYALGTISLTTSNRKTLPPASTRRRSAKITPSRSTSRRASASANGDSNATSAVCPTSQRSLEGVTATTVPGGSRSGCSSGPAT